jgi:hypothetical protein
MFDQYKLKEYIPYYDGSKFLDMGFFEIDETGIDKLVRKLSLNTHNKLEQYAKQNGWDENEMDLFEWVGESDLKDTFSRAYSSGFESGTSGAIHKAINDYMDSVWFLQKFDYDNYYISISVLQFLEIYTKYKSDFENGENVEYILKDESLDDLDVPYNGFVGYDDDAASEYLENDIQQLSVVSLTFVGSNL